MGAENGSCPAQRQVAPMRERGSLWQMPCALEGGTQEWDGQQDRCRIPEVGPVTRHQRRSCQAR